MRRWFNALPGPTAVKVLIAAVIVVVALVALFFVYDWIGTSLLDTGGAIE
jgi:hypothetical protein